MKRFDDEGILVVFMWLLAMGAMALLFLVLLISQTPGVIFNYLRWRCLLWASNRTGSVRRLGTRLGTGCLIVDSPSMCSATTQCWWTPRTAGELAPIPEPSEEQRQSAFRDDDREYQAHDYDVYCYDKYLSVETGTAILIADRNGHEIATRLESRYSDLHVVRTWSAAVKADRYCGVLA